MIRFQRRVYKHKIFHTLTFFPNQNITFNILGGKIDLAHEDLDEYVNTNCLKDQFSKQWSCGLCGQQCSNRLDVARHIESKHVNLPELACNICGKPSKTRNSLRMHMKSYHSQHFAM